ncbi:MAG: hypothetical protein M3404_00080 [Actinomycetota bacterium]|nr:hypothetical protein [Actinomycetota bacterium]
MALGIDASRALVRPGDFCGLVKAVLAASPEDETDWLEWKSTLDLSATSGLFAVSKAIIGFANRSPQDAHRVAEGHAYLVVGAEPGQLPGVSPIESHVLEARLARYLGQDGPRWTSQNVPIESMNVVVVDVHPPRQGERMYWLERTYQDPAGAGADSGTVFVRRQSSTEHANGVEMHRLVARMKASSGRPRLDVGVDLVAGPPVPVVRWDSDDVNSWIRQREARLLASLERSSAVDEGRGLSTEGFLPPNASAALERFRVPLQNMALGLREERTADEYREEVAEHLRACGTRLKDAALAEYSRRELGKVELALRNPTDFPFPGVTLDLYLPGAVHPSRYYASNEGQLPKRPRPFGEVRPFDDALRSRATMPTRPIDFGGFEPKFHVEEGSVRASYGPWDLAPHDTINLGELRVWASDWPEEGVVRGEWTARSMGADGTAVGIVEVPLGDDVGLFDLVRP